MKNLRSSLPLLVLLVFAVTYPFFGEKYYVDLVMKIMIFSVFALSLELLVGRRTVSFGHAAFFGIRRLRRSVALPQFGPASSGSCPPHVGRGRIVAVGALSCVRVDLNHHGHAGFAQMAYYGHDTRWRGSDGIYLFST